MTSALRSFPAIDERVAPSSLRELVKLSVNALRFSLVCTDFLASAESVRDGSSPEAVRTALRKRR